MNRVLDNSNKIVIVIDTRVVIDPFVENNSKARKEIELVNSECSACVICPIFSLLCT